MGDEGLPERLSRLPGVVTCAVSADALTLAVSPGTDARLLRARAEGVCAAAQDARSVVVVPAAAVPAAPPAVVRRAGRPEVVAALTAITLALVAVAPDGRPGPIAPVPLAIAPRAPDRLQAVTAGRTVRIDGDDAFTAAAGRGAAAGLVSAAVPAAEPLPGPSDVSRAALLRRRATARPAGAAPAPVPSAVSPPPPPPVEAPAPAPVPPAVSPVPPVEVADDARRIGRGPGDGRRGRPSHAPGAPAGYPVPPATAAAAAEAPSTRRAATPAPTAPAAAAARRR